jgi:hypothetical protein
MARTLKLTNRIELQPVADDRFQASTSCWELLGSIACSFEKYRPVPGPDIPAATAHELAQALESLLPNLLECVVIVQAVDAETQETRQLRELLCGDGGEKRIRVFIGFLRQGEFVIEADRPNLKVFPPDVFGKF